MRQTVQVHTIDQWMPLDNQTKSVILQNIRLKSRLETWLEKRFYHHQNNPLTAPIKKPCKRCDGTGQVEILPRLPGLHPSKLGSPCLLSIYHEMIGTKKIEPFDFRGQLIFDVGKQVHLLFQGFGLDGAWGPNYWPESRICEEKQPLAYDLLVEGSADAEHILVIDDIPTHPIYEVGLVHEYKTINESGFKKLTRPKDPHVQQAMVYSAILNRPIVVYVYLNKNDQNILDYPVPFDPAMWKLLADKAHRLNEFYDRNERPPGTIGFHCKECGYSHDCDEYTTHKKGYT